MLRGSKRVARSLTRGPDEAASGVTEGETVSEEDPCRSTEQ